MPDDPGCIAVVEDDPIMGESLQRALELEGWRALGGIPERQPRWDVRACPDLVLCDIRLPDMNGEEVFRARTHVSAPPFIFMTAFGQIDQAVSLVRAGAQDYLTKPFELEACFRKCARYWRSDSATAGKARLAYRNRCDELRRCSDGWLRGRCRFLSQGKPEPARRCARDSFMPHLPRRRSRSWLSTAPRFPQNFSKASCSDTNEAHSLEPINVIWDTPNARAAAFCSSTRSRRCRCVAG